MVYQLWGQGKVLFRVLFHLILIQWYDVCVAALTLEKARQTLRDDQTLPKATYQVVAKAQIWALVYFGIDIFPGLGFSATVEMISAPPGSLGVMKVIKKTRLCFSNNSFLFLLLTLLQMFPICPTLPPSTQPHPSLHRIVVCVRGLSVYKCMFFGSQIM